MTGELQGMSGFGRHYLLKRGTWALLCTAEISRREADAFANPEL